MSRARDQHKSLRIETNCLAADIITGDTQATFSVFDCAVLLRDAIRNGRINIVIRP